MLFFSRLLLLIRRSLAQVGFFCMAIVAGVHNGFAEDIDKGFEISQAVCARCHAIDPAEPWNSIGSSPSFMLMAKKFDRYQPRIMSVTARRPHIAQEFELSVTDLENVAAYVLTLRK